MAAERLDQRYDILELLGEGSTGRVYRVYDALRRQELALKAFSAAGFDEERLHLFEREFAALTQLAHPNIERVYDFGCCEYGGERLCYFTAECIAGPDLLAATEGATLARKLELVVQLLRALSYVHGRGLVHHDVKPDNVRVDPHGRVRLLDFGLALQARQRGERGLRGTIHYLAPELIKGDRADARADLYALGATLYAILYREPPFALGPAAQVLAAHMHQRPVLPPRDDVPAPLQTLILDLLAKEPQDRPASAAQVIASINAFSPASFAIETEDTAAARCTQLPLVGRERELALLREAHERLARSAGGVGEGPSAPRLWLITGPSGMGKRRLVRECRYELQRAGGRMFEGHAGAPTPFGPFEGLLRDLAAVSADTPASPLAEVPLTGPVAPEDRFDRVLAFLVATARRPTVLVLHDAQRLGSDALALLVYLLRNLAAAPILWLASAADDEDDREGRLGLALLRARLDAAGAWRELVLPPLGRAEMSALLREAEGLAPTPELTERLERETGGLPLRIEAWLRTRRTATGPDPVPGEATPSGLTAALESQIERLAPPLREAAAAASVFPDRFWPADLARAADLDEEACRRQLAGLVVEGLLLAEGSGGYRFQRPALRERLYEGLAPGPRRTLHERTAAALEDDRSRPLAERVEAIAYHLARALGGRSDAPLREGAFRFALAAARKAAALGAPRRAIQHYHDALSLCAQDQGGTQESRSLRLELAERCLRLGEFGAARHHLGDLLTSFAPQERDPRRVRALELQGELQRKRGDYEGALTALAQALAGGGSVESQARIYSGIGRVFIQKGEADAAIRYARRGLKALEEGDGRGAPAGAALGGLMATLGLAQTLKGNHALALESWQHGLDIHTATGDAHGIAECLMELGQIHELRGEHGKALEHWHRSLALRETEGDLYGIAQVLSRIGRLLEAQGQGQEARGYQERALRLAEKLGDRPGLAEGLLQLARAQTLAGLQDEAFERLRRALSLFSALQDQAGRARCHLALAEIHRLRGDHGLALELSQQALALLERAPAAARNEGWLADARIALALGDRALAQRRVREALQGALDLGDRPGVGQAYLFQGLLNLGAGRLRDAEGYVERALEILVREGQRPGVVEAHLAQAEIYAAQNRPTKALESLEAAETAMPGSLPPECQLRADLVRALSARGSDALGPLERALKTARKAGWPEWRWRIQHQLGRTLHELGKTSEAGAQYRDALLTIRQIWMRVPAEHQHAFLRQPDKQAVHADVLRLKSEPQGAPPPRGSPAVPIAGSPPTTWEVCLRGSASGRSEAPDRHTAAAPDDADLAPEARQILDMLTEVLTGDLELAPLLDLVVSMVVRVTRAERGFLVLLDASGGWRYSSSRTIDAEAIQAPESKLSHTIVQEVLAGGKSILLENALLDPRVKASQSVVFLELRSVLCVPLVRKDRVLGAIYLDNRFVERQFGEAERRLLETFAAKVAGLLSQSLEHARREEELAAMRQAYESATQALGERTRYPEIIGDSPAMRRLFELLDRIADTAHPVLICGESGTGKEMIAQAIHAHSARAQGPFVAENCAAFSEHLLEAELFGYLPGAYTGAAKIAKKGLLEVSSGGTLFLDELGEMSLEMQKKLLRVLEDGLVRPLGATESVPVDLRLISATNRDLKERMEAGAFLKDLYFRLNVIRVDLPPLRERLTDLPRLVDHFLKDLERGLEPEALERLLRHSWPGNIRELRNVVERAALLCDGERIRARDIIVDAVSQAGGPEPPSAATGWWAELSPRQQRALAILSRQSDFATPDYMRLAQVAKRTAIRDLNDLAERQVLVRLGRGRNCRYRMGPSLG